MTVDELVPTPVLAVVALGSNLGDRRATLEGAVRLLDQVEHTRVLRVSSWHASTAVGGPPGQGPYLNGVCLLETRQSARGLLWHMQSIEERAGRERAVPEGPRTLDLDLCFYGDEHIATPDLVVPHPRLEQRVFVLAPLAELQPDRVLAQCGLSVSARLDQLRGRVAGSDWVRALAPCKINPWLAVGRRREDGYSEVDLGLLALDLCDTVELRVVARGERAGPRVELSGPFASADVPTDGTNLAARAADSVLDLARERDPAANDLELELRIEKNVPSGAGLGGGSSDAAAAALAASAALGFDGVPPEVAGALAAIGSDCVFFVEARDTGFARGLGRGELIRSLPAPPAEWSVALLCPSAFASTAGVYAAFQSGAGSSPRVVHTNLFDLDLDRARAIAFNQLEPAALLCVPELRSWRDFLDTAGAAHFRMSGSGASFFGLFRRRDVARRELEELSRGALARGLELRGSWVAAPIGHGAKLA